MCPFSSSTKNFALDNDFVTTPSTSIASALLIKLYPKITKRTFTVLQKQENGFIKFYLFNDIHECDFKGEVFAGEGVVGVKSDGIFF